MSKTTAELATELTIALLQANPAWANAKPDPVDGVCDTFTRIAKAIGEATTLDEKRHAALVREM